MRLRKVAQGAKFDVYVLDRKSSGPPNEPAWDFLTGLDAKRHKAMIHRIQTHAQRGPLLNTQMSRRLEDGIFEFKTPNGDRLLFFYGERRQTILTNGFTKGARLATELRTAKQLRGEWIEWNRQNQ